MAFAPRARYTWRLRTRSLPLGRFTVVMGILNITPDSFSDGNRYMEPHAALTRALQMLDEGADIIDLGGESTRPNAEPVTSEQEQKRTLPVLQAILKARPDAIVSVDTYHAATAAAALQAGAEIINDVSGLIWDPAMAGVLAKHKPGAILMHTRGAPRSWNSLPPLPHADIMPMITAGLAHTVALARAAQFPRQHIVLDPGFGFGKQGDENFTLLAHFSELHQFQLPFLVGLSRKRFLTAHISNVTEEIRTQATTAANVAAVLSGAHLVRAHDVPAARAAASVADAIFSSADRGKAANHPSGVRDLA